MSQLATNFKLPPDFAKVGLVLIGMNLQVWYAGFQIGLMRKKIFPKQFMEKHFGAIHQSQLKEEIKLGGYPDMGSGLYSKELSYSDWYNFNILQRIHQNYIEGLGLATTAVAAAGVVSGNYGLGVGLVYMIGRMLYGVSYKKKGGAHNKGRIAGIALCYLSSLAGISIFLYNYFKK